MIYVRFFIAHPLREVNSYAPQDAPATSGLPLHERHRAFFSMRQQDHIGFMAGGAARKPWTRRSSMPDCRRGIGGNLPLRETGQGLADRHEPTCGLPAF